VAFDHFGEHFAIGFITGVAVDFALASWLLISRRLRAAGVKTAWGPVLEWATALMTLCLNSGASFLKGQSTSGRWLIARRNVSCGIGSWCALYRRCSR